jgi:hypothetical protein
MLEGQIDLIFQRLEESINHDDKTKLIECCNRLVAYRYTNYLNTRTVCYLFFTLALSHLRLEQYLLSYRAIISGLELCTSDIEQERGGQILEIIKQHIMQ